MQHPLSGGRTNCYKSMILMRPFTLPLFIGILLASTLAGQSAPANNDRAWQVLEEGFHNTNPIRRAEAVLDGVVLRPDARVVALLDATLDDKDSGVRAAGCTTLGALKVRSAIPRLRARLDDNVPEVIFAAAKALYAMDDALGRDVLVAVLEGEQSDASGFIAGTLRGAKLKLHDPKGLLLLGAQGGVGLAGPFGFSVPLAEGLMKDRDASGQTAAALLLATDTRPESLEALRTALKDKNWTVRSAAARAIATRDAISLYDDVAALLNDRKEEAQVAGAAALIRLRQPKPRLEKIAR
jgi:HEAT repeat protein